MQIDGDQHQQPAHGGGRGLEARCGRRRTLASGAEEILRRLELLRRHQEASRALGLEELGERIATQHDRMETGIAQGCGGHLGLEIVLEDACRDEIAQAFEGRSACAAARV